MNIIGRVLKWGIDRPKCCFFTREHDDQALNLWDTTILPVFFPEKARRMVI